MQEHQRVDLSQVNTINQNDSLLKPILLVNADPLIEDPKVGSNCFVEIARTIVSGATRQKLEVRFNLET